MFPIAETYSQKDLRARLRALGAALSAALLLVCAHPARLIGEDYQVQAAKRHRLSKLHSWLAAQDGAMGTAGALAESIVQVSEKHSLDPLLVLAVIQVESRFDRKAVSPRGAQGLMQVKQVAVDELVDEGKLSMRQHDLKDPQVNVQIGVSYLAHLIELFGDLNIALAAYNWGPSRTRETLAANQTLPSQYVSKVLSAQRSLESQLARFDSSVVEAG
jgi:soluble lytic murein transglycosylase-like protein